MKPERQGQPPTLTLPPSPPHTQITLLLEDMGLNLQSMLASPFVRPFLNDVRSWEQKLSLIGGSFAAQQGACACMFLHATSGGSTARTVCCTVAWRAYAAEGGAA